MESAARSGFLAADALLRGSGRQSQQLGDALGSNLIILSAWRRAPVMTDCQGSLQPRLWIYDISQEPELSPKQNPHSTFMSHAFLRVSGSEQKQRRHLQWKSRRLCC